MKTLNTMDFARVINDKKLKGTGLSRGDTVMVMGTKPVLAKKGDPYLFRTLMVVAKYLEGIVQVPGEGNDHKGYLVDPRSLEKVSDNEQEEYTKTISKQR
jgi:hypothetical protein